MKFFYVLIITLLSSLSFSQDLNIKFIEQIMYLDFSKVENFMIEGYGFKIIDLDKDLKKENGLQFFKIKNENNDSILLITVYKGSKIKINTLKISLAKNYSISEIKQNFIENNYLYIGEFEDIFWVYEKGDVIVSISKEPNKVGANQIIISNK
jgi:hypothetical protein